RGRGWGRPGRRPARPACAACPPRRPADARAPPGTSSPLNGAVYAPPKTGARIGGFLGEGRPLPTSPVAARRGRSPDSSPRPSPGGGRSGGGRPSLVQLPSSAHLAAGVADAAAAVASLAGFPSRSRSSSSAILRSAASLLFWSPTTTMAMCSELRYFCAILRTSARVTAATFLV